MSLPVAPTSPLPPRYAAWMDELLAGKIPAETHATCSDCAMCAANSSLPSSGLDRQSDARFYDPDVKCCSFVPVLWNFLVGDLLADASPESAAGRATVESRLAAGIAVTPLGLASPPVYSALYRHIGPAFGQTRAMLCPHYLSETGRCGVWRHRESTCATREHQLRLTTSLVRKLVDYEVLAPIEDARQPFAEGLDSSTCKSSNS